MWFKYSLISLCVFMAMFEMVYLGVALDRHRTSSILKTLLVILAFIFIAMGLMVYWR